MSYLGMNPNEANAAADTTMTVSESFQSLHGQMKSCVENCTDAAGEPEVTAGYGEFGEKWSTELAGISAHGESVGGNGVITVADGTGTDTANEREVDVPAPKPSFPGISLI